MPAKPKKIANNDQIFEELTKIMNGESEEYISTRDKLRAAELLAKRNHAFDKEAPREDLPQIIDNILCKDCPKRRTKKKSE